MKRLFARFALAAGAMLLSVASYGQTPINSVPYTISQSGTYVLNKDLFYTPLSGVAITINSGNVNLDFAGHSLDGIPGPANERSSPQRSSDNVR